MSRFNTVKTILSTVTIAVAVGFVVQYGESSNTSAATAGEAATVIGSRTMMTATNAQGEAVFGVPNVVTTPLDHAASREAVVPVDAVYQELATPRLGTIMATPVPGCETTVSASRQVAAVVELTVTAPCFEDTSFVVDHEGMRVAAITDREGVAVLTIPALVTDAAFRVLFNNVLHGETEIFVPELRRYDRAVLQWRNRTNMRLHALEDGAEIGGAGHVWSASIHSAADTREGRHGFVVYVGDVNADIPYQAEIYTFPAGQMNRDGGVDLRIGVSLNDANCGREVDARTIQTNAGETLVKAAFAAQMPGCDRAGEVIFLTNKFADLTLATN